MPAILPTQTNDIIDTLKQNPTVAEFVEFNKRSVRFVRKCNKPDNTTYLKSIGSTATVFIACGFAGYLVKVITTPILSGLVR